METAFYDGRRRSKVVLQSELECCQKYRRTLPDHVELEGSAEDDDSIISDSVRTKNPSSSGSIAVQSAPSLKSGAPSDISREDLVPPDLEDEPEIDSYQDADVEMVEEEEEYESSICSEWIVLKPDKKFRKKKAVVEQSSVSDLNEPAGSKRLMKRPPSPEGEVFDEESKPKTLIPSNYFKHQDLQEWPEPPPMDKALLKREPSPNISLPRSRENLELTGEDWLWFEGHYMESGALEIHGEDGMYYRLPTQWKDGHWEPAPTLLAKWEKEEMDLERERQRTLEERRKYDEILKREDSPGMDIINWGDGPVKMTAGKEQAGQLSLVSLSNLLPKSVSVRLLQIAADVPPEILQELVAKVDEAMMAENSLEMIQQLLTAYVSKGLDVVDMRDHSRDLVVQDSVWHEAMPAVSIREDFKTLSSKSVRFLEEQAGPEEDAEEHLIPEEQSVEEATPVSKLKILREDPCDPLPDAFRATLLQFIQDFVADKPGDPLIYAIGYFQSRIPKDIEPSLPSESDHSQSSRRLAAFQHRSSDRSDDQNIVEGEIEENAKTPKETEILVRALNSCWVTKDLDLSVVIGLVKAMFQIDVNESDELQTADEEPDAFYVIKKGCFKIQNEFGVKVLRDRGYFGELALNSLVSQSLKARFSVTSLKRGAVWCLRRSDYQRITDAFKKDKNTVLFSMMGVMDLFDNLTEEEKETVVDCLDLKYYKKKDVIFCQGTDPEGIYFFLDGVFKLIRIDDGRTSRGSSKRPSSNSQKKFYLANTYQAPRVLGYGNFLEGRPWGYSCVARSNIVQAAVLKTDVFERLLGDPEDVANRPPVPPPPSSRPERVKRTTDDEEYGEAFGEYVEEHLGEDLAEEGAPEPPPPPKVIPWLKKKVDADPDEPPKPKPPPTYDEIMAAMWGTAPTYQHPKEPCLCGQCKNAVTCVGQGMRCCDKPKVNVEAKK